MQKHPFLSQIRIVMVGTTLPANIGSAARAMHTMGLSDLVVVKPKLPIDDTSIANATAGAFILQNARITQTLEEALADCSLVLASSARLRHLPRPVVTPSQGAVLIDEFLSGHHAQSTEHPADPPKVAIVFGREDRGLTNQELSLAHHHIQIPANDDYPVLNVASAVQVICANIYERFATAKDSDTALDIHFRTDWDETAINKDQEAKLQANFLELFIKLNLARADDLKDLPNRLSRLGSRLQLDQKEYAMLQAVIAKIKAKL